MKSFKSYLLEGIEIPDAAYGYWITGEGKFLPVEDMMGHDRIAGRVLKVSSYNGTIEAFAHGWIRLVGTLDRPSVTASFPETQVTFRALSGLKEFIRNLGYADSIYINTQSWQRGDPATIKQMALGYLNTIHPRIKPLGETVIMESFPATPYGYWITDTGKILVVNGAFDHDVQAQKETGGNLRKFTRGAPSARVTRKGWIRIVQGDVVNGFPSADFDEKALTFKGWLSLKYWVKELEDFRAIIIGDNSLVTKQEAFEYLNTIKPKVAR